MTVLAVVIVTSRFGEDEVERNAIAAWRHSFARFRLAPKLDSHMSCSSVGSSQSTLKRSLEAAIVDLRLAAVAVRNAANGGGATQHAHI